MSFLRNAWYVAAWADEVVAGALVHRTLLNEPVLLFRDSQGVPHALLDRCPHRFAPLHRGKHLGDRIRCGYHGLEFSGEGRCVHNPHSEGRIPAAVRVKSYPLLERYSFLWIWMGEPMLADATTIPDFSFQDPAESYIGKRYLRARASYLLEIDNILDLSHIQFVHPTTLGSGDVSKGHYESSVDGETVWSKRSTHAEIMPEFLYRARNIPSGVPCDRWIDVRWNAPANMALFAGAVPTGEPRVAARGVSQAHVFTPETPTSTHYWFGIAFPRSLGEAGERMAREQVDGLRVPFEEEDLPMLEAQQRNMDLMSASEAKPLLFKIDAASAHARKILRRKLAAESSAAELIPHLKLHHVSISVPDMGQAIQWYEDNLGFKEEFRFSIDGLSAQGAFIARDAMRIELWAVTGAGRVPDTRKDPTSDLQAGGTKHVAFLVPDLQTRLAELIGRGVDVAAVQREPTQPMAKDHDPLAPDKAPAFAAFIRDPGGTLIELLDEEQVARHSPAALV